jgi:hypothetical protein
MDVDYDPAVNAANTLANMKNMPIEQREDAVEGLIKIYEQLTEKGYLPDDTAKTAFKALVDSGTFKEAKINESIASLPDITTTLKRKRPSEGGRKHKQHGGKDCDKTDYAILVAMMAVLYWTGAVPATVGYVATGAASYMPNVDDIASTMNTCKSYLSVLIPSAFPGDELAYAVGAVGNTFVRKVGEMMIILAEAANLSLKMGFSMGAKTIWDTTISWVKDNPTYVIAGYAGKTAIGWRKDAIALKRIKDEEGAAAAAAAAGAAPKALTQEQQNKYKDLLFNLVVRIRDLLCDLTDVIRNTTTDAATKIKEMSTVGKTAATTATNTDPDPIEEIREDLSLLKGLADAAAEASPLASPLASGGKRSTRKRNSRTRKPKSRKPKKRKSSGRKAKKASRKIKSRNGRKTRRRGSKKR